MSHRSARESRSTSKGRKRARLVDSAAEGRRNQGAQPARPQTYNERQLDSIILQKTAIPEFKRKSSLSATSTRIMHMPNFTPWKLEIRIERGEKTRSHRKTWYKELCSPYLSSTLGVLSEARYSACYFISCEICKSCSRESWSKIFGNSLISRQVARFSRNLQNMDFSCSTWMPLNFASLMNKFRIASLLAFNRCSTFVETRNRHGLQRC